MSKHIEGIFVIRLIAILAVTLMAPACKKGDESSAQRSSQPNHSANNSQEPETSEHASQTKQTEKEAANTVSPTSAKSKLTQTATKVTPTADKETAPPEVVTDPAEVAMEEGFPLPKRGDKIYVWSNLPEDACGEYWVKSSNGKVSRVAVCRDEH